MGNSNSKGKNSKDKNTNNGSGDGLQSYPSFSRSDTQGSSRSIRSMRSRLSTASDTGSYKSAVEQQQHHHHDGSDIHSSNNNNNNNHDDDNKKNSSNNTNENQTEPSPATTTDQQLQSEGYYPFPDVSGKNNSVGGGGGSSMPGSPMVPKSMQQVEPKDPILIYRDRDGNVSTPNAEQPATNGISSSSPGAADSTTNNSPENSNNNITNSTNHNSNNSNGSGFLSPASPGLGPMSPGLGGRTIISQSNGNGSLNLDEIIQRLLDAGYSGKTTRSLCVKNSEITTICQVSREIFLSQPTLLELSPPVKIVGDVHGQYGDLIRLFEMCGFPPAANYLFLGDYVDRGKQSLETALLLLCYKIKYPENFFLLRGNHECANVTRVYGFYDECKRRCNIKTWKTFIDTFNALPITAVVAHKIFCVHGGLSPSLNTLNEIRNIERPTDVPDYGLLNDLLWSDPADTVNEWEDNERGVSYCYNKVAINRFLTKFGFDLVCRAHMVVEDGYEFFNDRALVTVFSAPNYCGEFDNWGAVMSVSDELLCSFELLKPLDSTALKQEMRKGKHERRRNMALLNSPAQSPAV